MGAQETISNDLPMHYEDVTAEWVTQALRRRWPGVTVTGLRHAQTIGGTGSKIQLELEYDDAGLAAGLPPRLFVKGGFEWHEVAFAASYQAEARFYADWAPSIAANIPQGYFAEWNDRQGVVLIEDLSLRPVTFGSGDVAPLDVATIRKVLALLARIHAPFWNKPTLATLRSLGQRVGTNFIDHFLAPDYYASCIAQPKGQPIPQAFHDPRRMLAGLRANWAQVDTGPQSFCHGDPHQGNMFFETDGRPGYLDFQAYVRCAPLHDVNYVVVGSLSVEDRRQHDRALLGFYLDELKALGVRDLWSSDEAWDRFRRHTMHGLLWFATPEAMQPAAIVEAHSLRFGTAANDYELPALLGV
ncbi:MAG: phosphotransferase [Sphingomonadaceae bacterium]|nr:phosphotransferase [Sphingomonadaceae bacterium]